MAVLAVAPAFSAPCPATITVDALNPQAVDCEVADDLTINLVNGMVISPANKSAIFLRRPENATGNQTVKILRSGQIKTGLGTRGDNRSAIDIFDLSGDLDIILDQITTDGKEADGIRITSSTGDIDVRVHDSIKVFGQNANGVLIEDLRPQNERTQTAVAEQKTTVAVHDVLVSFTDRGDAVRKSAGINVKVIGALKVDATGTIVTHGPTVDGIYIDRYDTDSTEGGQVDVSVNAIHTLGDDAYGIHVSNLTSENFRSQISVGGLISTQGEESHAIVVNGDDIDTHITIGRSGILEVHGAGAFAINVYEEAGGSSSLDVLHGAHVSNRGIIKGNIAVETCLAPHIDNEGRIESAETINLIKRPARSADNAVVCADRTLPSENATAIPEMRNAGVLSPGGARNIAAGLNIDASYVQTPAGELEIDADWKNDSVDNVQVTRTAQLDGILTVGLLSVPLETSNLDFFTAMEGLDGVPQMKARDSYLVDFGIGRATSNSGSETLSLSAKINLDRDGLNRNQKSVLRAIDASYKQSEQIEQTFASLLSIIDVSKLRWDLDSLGNELAGAAVRESALSALQVAERIPACRSAHSSEPFCLSIDARGHDRNVAGTWSQRGHDRSGHELAIGTRLPAESLPVSFEFGAGRNAAGITSQPAASASSRETWLAAQAELQWGNFSLRGAASLSYFNHQMRRKIGHLHLSGELPIRGQSLQAAIAYRNRFGRFDLEPSITVSGTILKSSGYQESGAGDLSLSVAPGKHRVVRVTPSLSARTEIGQYSGFDVSAKMGLSWSRLSGRTIDIDSGLAGGTGRFISRTVLPKAETDISAMVEFIGRNGVGRIGVSRTELAGRSGNSTRLSAGYRWVY